MELERTFLLMAELKGQEWDCGLLCLGSIFLSVAAPFSRFYWMTGDICYVT